MPTPKGKQKLKEDQETVRLSVDVPIDLYEDLQRMARTEHRSIVAQALKLLENELKKPAIEELLEELRVQLRMKEKKDLQDNNASEPAFSQTTAA